jgi:hypothetical protein
VLKTLGSTPCTYENLLYVRHQPILTREGILMMTYLFVTLATSTFVFFLLGLNGLIVGVIAGILVSTFQKFVNENDVSNNSETGFEPESDELDFWDTDAFSNYHSINPASGLPMMGDGIGGFDVGGNTYGTDSSFCDVDSINFSDDLFHDISDPF